MWCNTATMKQLHGKTKNSISSSNDTSDNSSNLQQQQLDQPANVVENKFRCKVLPEHFTGAIPFVRVNDILNYDWFVWMPDDINAGDTFVFIILNDDLRKAQELRHLEATSTLTPTEQLNYNTKIVNKICKDIPVNSRPTRQQQELILQALHPYVPIISNSIIESRDGVTCPIFYKLYGPHAANSEERDFHVNQIKNNKRQPLNNSRGSTAATKSRSMQDYVHELELAWMELYTIILPNVYHEICNVDSKRLLVMVIGYIFTFILGFIVALIYQDIMNNRYANGQCRA